MFKLLDIIQYIFENFLLLILNEVRIDDSVIFISYLYNGNKHYIQLDRHQKEYIIIELGKQKHV